MSPYHLDSPRHMHAAGYGVIFQPSDVILLMILGPKTDHSAEKYLMLRVWKLTQRETATG